MVGVVEGADFEDMPEIGGPEVDREELDPCSPLQPERYIETRRRMRLTRLAEVHRGALLDHRDVGKWLRGEGPVRHIDEAVPAAPPWEYPAWFHTSKGQYTDS